MFELSSALTIVAIERDLCQTDLPSLDHSSPAPGCFLFINKLTWNERLVTECVHTTSLYSRMKVTPTPVIAHWLLFHSVAVLTYRNDN